MGVLSGHFPNSFIRGQARGCPVSMVSNILVIVLAALFLLYFALQVLDLVVRWPSMVAYLGPNGARVLANLMLLLEGILTRLWTAVFVVSALTRGLVVALAHLSLAYIILLLVAWLVRCHYDILEIYVIVHVVKCCLGLGCGLVELREHVEFVVDVLRRVSLRMQEHRVGVHLGIGLLLSNLHFDIG